MASPHVAGVAALLKSQFPDKTGSEIRTALERTAEDVGACGNDRMHGNGLVNVVAAAAYLEGTGPPALEQTGCIETRVSVTTDDWGEETYYLVSSTTTGEIMYRGGPYENGQRATYIDTFYLPPDCYMFQVLDSYGDGVNNPETGIGEFTVEYNGEEASIVGFEGSEEIVLFGCETACPNGHSLAVLMLETDEYANVENQLFLYDVDDPNNYIWDGSPGVLQGSTTYILEECLDPSACYDFFYFDTWGDGFLEGGLTFIWEGEVVLTVEIHELGENYDSSTGVFWSASVGNCPDYSNS